MLPCHSRCVVEDACKAAWAVRKGRKGRVISFYGSGVGNFLKQEIFDSPLIKLCIFFECTNACVRIF